MLAPNRVGFVNLMPYPVISGFLTGVGCILIIMQLAPLLGYEAQSTAVNALSVLPADLTRPNTQALALGLIALAVVLLLPKKWTRIVPAPLAALVATTLIGFRLIEAPTLGTIPSALPQWQVPSVSFPLLNQMLIYAAVLVALGSIDSLLTSLVVVLVLTSVVLALTVFVDVITAVGVGVVIASLIFVKDMAELQVNAIRTISDPAHERLFDPQTADLFRAHRDALMFLHLSGPVSFGAASELTRRFANVGDYRVLIIDLLDVPHVVGSAAVALEEVILRAREEEKHVIIVGMTFGVARLLGRLGTLDVVRESERFDTRPEAVGAAVEFLRSDS